jgi:hypothetical protein
LKEDDKRREKQLDTLHPMSWNNPRFDTPFERRRLRILNTLFSEAARMNGKPTIGGREARSIHVTFYQQHVGVRLDRAKQHSRRGSAPAKPPKSNDSKLSLAILENISQKDTGRSMEFVEVFGDPHLLPASRPPYIQFLFQT